MELILLLIIIINIVRIVKKNTKKTSAPKPGTPPPQTVQSTVNRHLFGTSTKPTDKYQLYRRFIEQDRYSDLAKLGHELGISKQQAAQDIKYLQRAGHFKTVTLDERNYKLIYSQPAKYATGPASAPPAYRQTPPKQTPSRQTPSGQTPASIAGVGKRHEEWMELPPHHQSVKCHYCGALNALPLGRRSKYTCYFCREEL